MDPRFAPPNSARAREQHAEVLLADLFGKAGWQVQVREDAKHQAPSCPDMVLRRGKASYAVELKTAAEGRSDRLIPLWAQAYLQAIRLAGDHPPLAVVAAPKIAPRVAEQILKFAAEYAPNGAAGVIDFAGLHLFRGPALDGLDSDEASLRPIAHSLRHETTDLFSDLNQWMLKVLLAPELPEKLLSAPRGKYRNASQLARAANVSVMSAFRFVQQLQHEGYLNEAQPHLAPVRREDLFRRWEASAARRVKEMPMRFLLHKDPRLELKRMLQSGRICLGLFAAAEELGLGFVHGVPAHVYVHKLGPASLAGWKNLAPAEAGEVPNIILRQASAPQSIFRGLVRANELPVCDVLQIWLDVSSHPTRGREQAHLIRRQVLDPIIKAGRSRG